MLLARKARLAVHFARRQDSGSDFQPVFGKLLLKEMVELEKGLYPVRKLSPGSKIADSPYVSRIQRK
jgi:hypothetical protein